MAKPAPARSHETEIVKRLERVGERFGHGVSRAFEDWLELVEAALGMRAIREHGAFAEDSPPVQKLWDQMRERYHNLAPFADAFGILLESAVGDDGLPTYRDVLGPIFMEVGHPGSGQFFTPRELATTIALMTITDGTVEVQSRLKEAIAKSPAATAMLLAGLVLESAEAQAWFIERVLPAALEHYEPISIYDPCVGSGGLLLAAAAVFPRWMVELGLVTFYGQDIDPRCVQMTRINCRIYGLRSAPVCLAT